eukprot:gnl/Trimastix_PCT/2107.p1 GENE.gnl/Trimastix_PCT/2107~~gnl/Trimastix_PCT/2107.p1  ORF type:complete len:520 (+),score=148.45 gnl/Trimastix_PCT/2107:81-1640(+)
MAGIHLETLSKKGLILSFSLFGGIIAISLLISCVTTNVYIHADESVHKCGNDTTTLFKTFDSQTCDGVDLGHATHPTWNGMNGNPLIPGNQMILLAAYPQNKDPALGIESEINFHIETWGCKSNNLTVNDCTILSNRTHVRQVTCPRKSELCNPLVLLYRHGIHYPYYQLRLRMLTKSMHTSFIGDWMMRWKTYNPSFSTWEVVYRLFLCAGTFFALILFLIQFCRAKFRGTRMSGDQRWIVVLLVTLLLLNNPLFFLCVLSGGGFWSFLNNAFIATFAAVVMLHLLLMLNGLVSTRRSVGFYAPPAGLLGAFWLCILVALCWQSFHQRDDPMFNLVADVPGFVVFGVFVALIIVVYALWIFYRVVQLCGRCREMGAVATRFRVLLFTVVLATLLFALGLIFNVYLPTTRTTTNKGGDYLTLFTLANCYVWLLTLLYTPSADPVAAPLPTGKIRKAEPPRSAPGELDDDDLLRQDAAAHRAELGASGLGTNAQFEGDEAPMIGMAGMAPPRLPDGLKEG